MTIEEAKVCARDGCERTFLARKRRDQQFCSADCYKASVRSRPFDEVGLDRRREQVIEEQGLACRRCGLDEWLGEPLVLELEHKDGNHSNNSRENLEALCPNCHSLTSTWRGRNKGNRASDDAMREALGLTLNVSQALRLLKLTPKGKNYERAKRIASEMGIAWKRKHFDCGASFAVCINVVDAVGLEPTVPT